MSMRWMMGCPSEWWWGVPVAVWGWCTNEAAHATPISRPGGWEWLFRGGAAAVVRAVRLGVGGTPTPRRADDVPTALGANQVYRAH
jgi:hypothetical protein